MPDNNVTTSFGTLLRIYRERTVDRRQGRQLSQDRLARKLSEKTGLIFNRNNIGSWELDKAFFSIEDRRALIALITILFEYAGITTLEEANHLLEVGNYRELNDHEKEEISLWLKEKGFKNSPLASATPTFRSGNSGLDGESNSHPETFAGILSSLHGIKHWFSPEKRFRPQVELYEPECGDMPIDLASQRLQVSSSFGAYFVGLLEKPNLYLNLESQIDCPIPRRQEGLAALQRIFWLLEYARGPRTFIISGEGGMGKSTLSAKIIRCLYQEQAIDLILGDSAKSEHIDPLTKKIIKYEQGYYDPASFYARLCSQLGLPAMSRKQAILAIRDRLLGRKAIIILDNLETVMKGDEILDSLKALTSRDIRAIVTTRQVHGIKSLDSDRLVVQIQPLTDPDSVEDFLIWHIDQHQYQHPALRSIRSDIAQHSGWLIERTGGIPLLMQLVLSDVARFSWEHVQSLPTLFGKELLDFLYQSRWDELGRLGKPGQMARKLVCWIAQEQYKGQAITSKAIGEWAVVRDLEQYLSDAMAYLFEMFLIINRDSNLGNFSIYPSLIEFIEKQEE